MKKTYIGGQAIIEGVMMRGKKTCALAVWSSKTDLTVEKMPVTDVQKKFPLFRLPIFRGMAAFFESMVMGTKILNRSAEIAWDAATEDEEPSEFEKKLEKLFGDKFSDIMIYLSVGVALVLGIGLFIMLPVFIGSLFKPYLPGEWLLGAIEGGLRLLIFLLYLYIISKMKEVRRLFKYHGAEHKTINCFEHGDPLTVENVRKHSREHKRCGTSFLLIVMIISIIVFFFIRTDTLAMRLVTRLILIPFVAGISYEFIKWAGSSNSALSKALSRPGMCLQKMTTFEPDDEQIKAAIAAMEGVLEDEGENPYL